MSLTRALAWNTGAQLGGKVISTIIGIVIVGLMTRLLGQEGFGAYSTANAFLQIFALLLDLGLNVTLVALLGEHAGDDAYEKRCVSAFFTLRLLTGFVVLVIIAPAIAWISPYSITIKLAVFALIASFFFPSLGQIVTGVQQRHLKMHLAAIGEILGRVVLLIGLLFAGRLGWGLVPIVSFVSLASIANFAWIFFTTRKFANFRWNWDPTFWKSALHRSWPVGVTIAFGLIYFKADTLILSLMRSQAEVGIYGAAYRVLEILITVPFMFAGILLPILAKAWVTKNQTYFSLLIARAIDVMMIFVIPLMVGTWILGTKVMMAVAGKDFALSGDVMKILVIAVAVIYLNTIFSHAVIALNVQRKMIPIYIVVALVTLVGYALFIPTYGLWAAAWLTVFSETCVGLGSLVITHRATPITFQPKTTIAACFAAIIMSLVLFLLQNTWLPITIFAGILVYFFFLCAFGGVSKKTLQEILSWRGKDITVDKLTEI
ncbi:MAG: flippase [Candidatus Uhrbacteria bacterium]|nr:flippase [Candidatus Uhrbacteria bacterium]